MASSLHLSSPYSVSSILIYFTIPSSFPCPHPSSLLFFLLLFCLLLFPFLFLSSPLPSHHLCFFIFSFLLISSTLSSSFIILLLFSHFSLFLFIIPPSSSFHLPLFSLLCFLLFLYFSSSSSRTEDSGPLTHKENLPVRALVLGDIRRPGSEAAYWVGPLRCHGDSRSSSGCLVTLDGEMTDHCISENTVACSLFGPTEAGLCLKRLKIKIQCFSNYIQDYSQIFNSTFHLPLDMAPPLVEANYYQDCCKCTFQVSTL